VINNKISVTEIRLHHYGQANTIHDSSVAPGEYIKKNCQKLVESMPKRGTKFLSLLLYLGYGIITVALLVRTAIAYY